MSEDIYDFDEIYEIMNASDVFFSEWENEEDEVYNDL